MKLSAWPQVEALILARTHMIRQLGGDGPIEVVISGCHQSAEFVEHVGPAIRLELRHQIEAVERRLQALGIQID